MPVDTTPLADRVEAGISRQRSLSDQTIPIEGYYSVYLYKHLEDKWYTLAENKKNLLTNGGRDLFHAQCYTNVSAGTRGGGCIAVTSDATAPAATDTVLTGEISTNGLARADATTKTHGAGTNSTLIEHEWTASGTHNNVQKCGLFNATSSGTLTHTGTFTTASLISGDKLKVSYTLNLG